MDIHLFESRRILVSVVLLLLAAVSPLETEYADITTIYKFQLNSNNGITKYSTGTKCQVYIHTGPTSKHLPFVINNEIEFPKTNAILNFNKDNLAEVQNQTKENNLAVSKLQTYFMTDKENANETSGKVDNKSNIIVNGDLNRVLIFDSNNIADTQWAFDSRAYNTRQVQNIDTSKLGDLFSKAITRLKVNFILNEIEQTRLNDIVAKNNSEFVSIKTKDSKSNVPSIIKLSKQIESKCESCRFDFYKTKNGTQWDLIIIRNYKDKDDRDFKESTEEEFELENNPIKEMQNDDPSNFRVDNDTSNLRNTSKEFNTVKDQEDLLIIKDKYVKSRRSQNLESDEKIKSYLDKVGAKPRDAEPMLPDDQNYGMKFLKEETLISSRNKLLISYDNKDEIGAEDSILKTTLEASATYLLKFQFKTQSYFKVAFLMDNSTEDASGAFETVEVTVRGTCEDVSGADESRTFQYYVDVNTGKDFKTLTINPNKSQNQTLEIMFSSEKFVHINNGFVNHQVELSGAQIYDIEFYNICFDNGFNRIQFELFESVSSYFSTLASKEPSSSKPSLTSPWLRNQREICWTILFTNLTRRLADYKNVCYDEDNIDNEVGIQVNVEHGDGHEKQIHTYCVETNGDIVRMIITYENNSTDTEFIRFLIEIDETIGIRFIYNSICRDELYFVKEGTCDAIDKVAHSVAYIHDYYKTRDNVDHCLNLGSLVEGTCLCPPGFKGKHCEVACGENKFGKDCSGECTSRTSTSDPPSRQCQGMLLCTRYGCGCAPGYRGKYCAEQCSSGQYGNDCKGRCGQCANNTTCNVYTGHCTECASNYLIPPYCQESYPYVIKPPRLLNTSYFSVQLEVNTQPHNVRGYLSEVESDFFFVILTKDLTWKTQRESKEFALDLKSPNSTDNLQNIWIHNLVPGHMYSFQVLLFDDIGNTHDPDKAPITNAMTKCIIPAYEHKVKVEVTSTTAQLYWYVTNVSYGAWNNTKTDINKLHDAKTTINQINILLNSTTNVEVFEDLDKLTLEELNRVFKCRKDTQYSLTVKKIAKKNKTQEFRFSDVNSGFTLKYLDPGNKYLVRVYLHNNNYNYEIFSSVVETKAELSEMDDLEMVKKLDKNVFIRWNTNQGRRIIHGKKTKGMDTKTSSDILDGSKNRTNGTNLNQSPNAFQHDKHRTNFSDSTVGKTIYYIKYKIVKQRACNQFFNHNIFMIETTKTEYKLELDYFTTYSIFITQNKGQTLANQYLFVSTNASVPDISPNLLHITNVSNNSVSIAWADISLSNYECALLNGMLVAYEVQLRGADNSRETRLCEELELEWEGLSPDTEYWVELRYVNHVGKSKDRFASLWFRTL